MTLDILGRLSDPGSASTPNEDAAGHAARAAWVLDGATGLTKDRLLDAPSDAAWLAARYDRLLAAEADNPGRSLPDLVAALGAAVGHAFERERLRSPGPRFELPSAGLAIIRLEPGRLTYAHLGDCRVILQRSDGRVIATPPSSLQALDQRVIGRMQALRRDGQARDYAAARAAVQPELQANRGLLNSPGGYWVLGAEPDRAAEVARHLVGGEIPLAPGERIVGLLVTDGFYRLVDTLRSHADDAALLAAARTEGLDALLRQLRAVEEADPDCVRYPRLKPKDDATALLLEAASP